MRLGDRAAASGYRLEVYARLDSTNDEAMRRARAGEAGRLWIVAQQQTKGRGRHGRQWRSPEGNLYASLLLIDAGAAAVAPQLGFVAGVALANSVSGQIHDPRRVALKWPNDLLCDGAKLAGILLEGAQLATGAFACVIGIGVNCRSHPVGLPYPATNLGLASDAPDPEAVFERLSDELTSWFDVWDGGRGFERIRSAWLAFACGKGELCRVAGPQGVKTGLFQGVDEVGRLLLEENGRMITVEAGDVLAPMRDPAAPGKSGRA